MRIHKDSRWLASFVCLANLCILSASGQSNPNPDRLVWIPAGVFVMGSAPAEQDRYDDEGPVTLVTLSEGFWMGKYEVTQWEYQAVIGNNPSWFVSSTNNPVDTVSWGDATNYCALLTQRERLAGRLPTGYEYRLPTDAEWEYAGRAGTRTRFSFGDDPAYTNLVNYAWFATNSANQTHPVGGLLPNPWGLYDMYGNAWEWCLDYYTNSLPGGQVTDPQGPPAGTDRVLRGGSIANAGRDCRSAHRDHNLPGQKFNNVGFRVVLALSRSTPPVITVGPVNQQAYLGANVTMQFEASGDPAPTIQWLKAGASLPGQTNATLALTNVQLGDSGVYAVVLTNPLGSTNSLPAALTVIAGAPSNPDPAHLAWIPAGTYVMGSPTNEADRYDDEGPQTQVTIAQGFWMGRFEVTQFDYLSLLGANPSHFTNDLRNPVDTVSWLDATNYCALLTAQAQAAGRLPSGYVYRLPTEAEWEYAGRAGTTTRFYFGDDINYTQLPAYAWFDANSSLVTHPTGGKQPNLWGLYDIYGNVWEWCGDWYTNALPGGIIVDPTGPADGAERVLRGGSENNIGLNCRSARRDKDFPTSAYSNVGLRVVLAPALRFPPQISEQPVSQSVYVGATVTFKVGASGNGPLSYQWQKDGANLAGQTNASLTVASVQTSDAGNYQVVVSNADGTAASQVAALTVSPLVGLGIITPPQNLIVATGSNAVFSVVANGTPPVTYQWKLNGANVAGATQATLVITNAQATNAGVYAVVVSDVTGSVLSSGALLTVLPPGIPAPIVIFDNSNNGAVDNNPPKATQFTVNQAVAITSIQDYHWNNGAGANPGLIALVHRDGTFYGPWPASGAPGGQNTTNAYWIVTLNVQIKPGTYTVLDSDPTTWSQNAGSGQAGFSTVYGYALGQIAAPTITQQPVSQNITAGTTVSFTVAASGASAYQWLKDGIVIVGATNATLTIVNAQPGDAGAYTARASNGGGSVTSQAANLSVYVPLIILTGPSLTAPLGVPYQLTFQAFGGLTPYTWQLVSGSLPSPLTFNGQTGLLSGTPATIGASNFRLRVTGADGLFAEKDFTLIVAVVPLVILTDAALPSGKVGAPYQQTVQAAGGQPPYLWSLVAGSLPPGLGLGTNSGALTGTPTIATNTTFTLRVAGADSQSTDKDFNLTVNAAVVPPGNLPRLSLNRSGSDLVLEYWNFNAQGTLTLFGASSVTDLRTNATVIFTGPIPTSQHGTLTLTNTASQPSQFINLMETP